MGDIIPEAETFVIHTVTSFVLGPHGFILD